MYGVVLLFCILLIPFCIVDAVRAIVIFHLYNLL